MYDEDLEDERMCVAEYARQFNTGDKQDIQLYEELSLALELMKNDSFKLIGSRISDGMDFQILTKYPDGLPDNIGIMFFNIDSKYKVSIEETPLFSNGMHNSITETNFSVKIKKR
jgi:hypothetical protein